MDIDVIYVVDSEQAKDSLNDVLTSPIAWTGNDTETTGLDPHTCEIRLYQLSLGNTVYVFDVWKIGKKNFVNLFNNFLTKVKNLKKPKFFVFHNFKFDVKMLWSLGIDFTNLPIYDTMLASQIINCGLNVSASLKNVMSLYLGIELDKAEQLSDWSAGELTESQIEYASKDVVHLPELARKLYSILSKDNLTQVFNLEMRAVFGFAMMEYYGMKADIDRLRKVQPIYEEQLRTSTINFLAEVPLRNVRSNLLGEVVDEGVEPSSNSQVLSVLRSLNIPNPVYNPDSSEPKETDPIITSTGSPVLKLVDVVEYPIVNALLENRKAAKILSSYIYNLPELINPVTKRLHTEFNQIISTGRSSSTNPNLNQLPRPTGNEALDEDGKPLSIRSCFVPGSFVNDAYEDEDYRFALSDFSQIELRVMAEVCGDQNMREEFLQQKDPYSSTASFLSGIPYEQLVIINEHGEDKVRPEYKKLRQNAKAVRLGLNYGMWWKKLRTYAKQQYGVEMSQKEAKANYDKYFTAYPGLKNYHNLFNNPATLEARTLAPFYRRRLWDTYPGVPSLCNMPIQGTSGDIQKLAIANIYFELHKDGYSPTQSKDVRLVLTVHDELEIEAVESKQDYAAELLSRNMVEAGQFVIKTCPIIAEADIVMSLAEKS